MILDSSKNESGLFIVRIMIPHLLQRASTKPYNIVKGESMYILVYISKEALRHFCSLPSICMFKTCLRHLWVVAFQSLAPRHCRFEFWQVLWFLSCEKVIQFAWHISGPTLSQDPNCAWNYTWWDTWCLPSTTSESQSCHQKFYTFFLQIFGPGKKLGSIVLFTMCLLIIASSISLQLFCSIEGFDNFETFPKVSIDFVNVATSSLWHVLRMFLLIFIKICWSIVIYIVEKKGGEFFKESIFFSEFFFLDFFAK